MAGFYADDGDKFGCPYRGCSRSFPKKTSMRIHKATCPHRPKKKIKNRAKKGQRYKDMD